MIGWFDLGDMEMRVCCCVCCCFGWVDEVDVSLCVTVHLRVMCVDLMFGVMQCRVCGIDGICLMYDLVCRCVGLCGGCVIRI